MVWPAVNLSSPRPAQSNPSLGNDGMLASLMRVVWGGGGLRGKAKAGSSHS